MDKKEENKISIYTPHSQLIHPSVLLGEMFRDLRHSFELASRLFIRNISSQYRQSLLGYVWVFLPPIATTLIFVFLKSQKVIAFEETDIPYPLYVMMGTLIWQVFVDALHSPIKLITSSKTILSKVHFPREALILAGIGEVIFCFLVRVIIFITIVIWFQFPIYSTIIFIPIGIVSLMLLGLMFGLLLTPLAVLYQDIQMGLTIIISLWFFLTPIVYPVPQQWPASLLATLNPVSPLVITTRDWIILGKTTALVPFITISTVSLFFIFLGWLIYRIAMPHLIARIGS